jgi:exosome complex exonuclease DIS3/RRP44
VWSLHVTPWCTRGLDPKRSANQVRKLNHLARIFRRRRMEAGALTLASPEVKFVLDTQTQNPLDVTM